MGMQGQKVLPVVVLKAHHVQPSTSAVLLVTLLSIGSKVSSCSLDSQVPCDSTHAARDSQPASCSSPLRAAAIAILARRVTGTSWALPPVAGSGGVGPDCALVQETSRVTECEAGSEVTSELLGGDESEGT